MAAPKQYAMSSGTVRKLDRIPMLTGLVAVTLYGVAVTAKTEIHGTAACYSDGGCRCDACRLANANRVREWMHATGRVKRRYAAVDARRGDGDG